MTTMEKNSVAKDWNGFRTFCERTVQEKLSAKGDWWEKPNKAFAGQTPNQVWEKNPTSVVTYLMDLKC